MFRRGRKFISLLIAAASVVSIVPVNASAASYTKISDEEGTIYNAVAYKDGKFYIDGEPKKKDESVYFLDNGSYSELKKLDTESDISLYGSKYIDIDNGEYYLDLSSGKLSEDDIEEDETDEASEALRKKVKDDNDGRYESNDSKNYKNLTKLPNSKWGDTYYKTEYKTEKAKNSINGGATEFTVYTNASGKYIDSDYNLGTVKVKLNGGTTAKVSNTNEDDEDVRVNVYDTKEIGQDSTYIYRIAMMCVNAAESGKAIEEVNGIEVKEGSTLFQIEDGGKKVDFKVIQAISKAQASKDIDGIKYAKTVYNYFIADKDGDVETLLNEDENSFSVVSGEKLINYKIDGSDLSTQVIELKSKGSVYYMEVEDGEDLELNDGETSFDTDVDGNLWGISEDYIYKFDNKDEWEKVYKVNDDFVSLSVYDEKNLVAWSEDDETYSIIYNKSSDADKDNDNNDASNTNNDTNSGNNNTSNITNKGWVLGQDGKWYFYKDDGTKATGWYKDGATWYYLKADGVMATGWQYDNGTWYYLKESGAMATGWVNDGGTWYYLNASGAMLSNTTVNGYKLGPTGAWIK